MNSNLIGRAAGLWNFFALRILLITFALALTACGGGGDSSGGGASASGGDLAGSGAAVNFSAPTLSANFEEGTSSTLTLKATLANPSAITGPVYLYIVDPKSVLAKAVRVSSLGSGTYQVTANTSASLPNGRYQGEFQVRLCKDSVCSSEYAGSPTTLPYDFVVSAAPVRLQALSPASITLHREESSTTEIGLSASGPLAKSWTASSSAAWLKLSASSGVFNGSLKASFSIAGLAPGAYSAEATINSVDGQKASVPFTLNIIPAQFSVSSGAPSFRAINGAPIAAQSLSFFIDNNKNSAWTATTSAPWLVLSQNAGTTPSLLVIQPDPSKSNLASGTHSTNLTLTSPGNPDKQIAVQLGLTKPTISTSSNAVTFGGPKGRDLGASVTTSLTLNTGANTWPLTLSDIPIWLNSNLTATQIGADPVTASFSPKLLGIPIGSTSATLTANAAVNGDLVSLPITVNLNVDQRRLLSSEWGVGLATTASGSRLSRTVKISDSFGAAGTWSAVSDAAWLSVTGSGTTPGAPNLSMTVNPISLGVDTLSYATITVSSTDAAVAPAVIKVGFWKSTTGLTAALNLTTNYTALVADKIRPYVYANNGGTTIDVYHAHRGVLLSTISSVGAALGQMTVSPDGSKLFATDTANKTLVLVDLSTRTKLETWPLDNAVNTMSALIAVKPNGAESVVLGDGTAYNAGQTLGRTSTFGVALAATLDGRRLFTTSTTFDLDSSAIAGGILMIKAGSYLQNGGSNQQDVAVSADGTRAYVASGSPYQCRVLNGQDGSYIGSLPGGAAYPNNVEVTSDGRVICGISGWYASSDFWVHSSAGALIQGYKVAGYARALKPGQMVVTPDGLFVVALTDDPRIAFVPIGP